MPNSVLATVKERLANLPRGSVRDRATSIISKLEEELRHHDLNGMMPWMGGVGDDGAFVIEWTATIPRKKRVGLCIEVDEKDDGWYQVDLSKTTLDEMPCGRIADVDLQKLVTIMVEEN